MLTLLIACLVGFALAQIAALVTTVYLHRSLSHRALTLAPPLVFLCRVTLWILTGMRPRQWVAVHRKHHVFTDVEGDPHSPVMLGWLRVQLGNVGLYRSVASDPEQVSRYARDLPPDDWDRMLFDRWWLGIGIGIGLLCLLLGPGMGLLAAVLHAVLYLSLSAAVNAVAHTFGKRPYDNSATNVQWLAWITFGEGLHNNHHAIPTSAKLALHPGETDLAWPVIRILQLMGLASIRLEDATPKESARES